MKSIQDQIGHRIRNAQHGRVFTPKDFLDLGSRAAADQVLSRLVRQKDIQRIGRGLYYLPRTNARFGLSIPPDLDQIAEALGRQTGSRIVPSGAVAANRLGLSTQVPARPVFLTDGRSRNVRVGNIVFQLRHAPPKDLPIGSRTNAMVLQALRHLGKDALDDRVVAAIRRSLSAQQRRELSKDAHYTTDWISQAVRRIVARQKGALIHG